MKLKDYIPLPMPDGYSEGLLFYYARGKRLDIYGHFYNVPRRKFLFIREPDVLYKIRLRNEGIKRVIEGLER
ncbi:hypothetical protein [Geobacillus kaustophilus]|uniref:hypothetical protein n=1 Tax=Geobacillus kaustophilus TaxID=1462 RepID=UPI000A774F04|nr:hypothetical protein [Geobacillus kaustophilus]